MQTHLITHVTTTSATEQDTEVLPDLHQALAQKELLLREHLLDQGYSDSHSQLQADEQYNIELIMPEYWA